MPNGAIWVVSRKGKAATLRDVEVIAAAKAGGLVDNKVASFDDDADVAAARDPRALRPPRAEPAAGPAATIRAWTSSSSSSSS